MSGDPVRSALAAILGPGRPEVTCEECFDLLDRYVEIGLAGGDADAAVPGMHAHLDGCRACREDAESLRALLAETDGDAPTP